MNIGFIIQVDTLCHRIPNFIEKAARGRRAARVHRAGEHQPGQPDRREEAAEQHHRIPRHAADNGASIGAITYAGYILGFPGDTPESILRDIEHHPARTAARYPGVLLLTPLPGSEDHKTLWQQGAWMDPDMNKYDLNHRVSHHARMSDAEWDAAYRDAWTAYYTPEHMRTILRRAAAHKAGRPKTALATILWFSLVSRFEGVHPLEGGALRLKSRRDRRHGMKRENPLVFYPREAVEIARKARGYWRVWRRARAMLREVLAAPDRWTYTDLAIAPPAPDERETLDLYHATSGGEAALARQARDDAARARVAARHAEPVGSP